MKDRPPKELFELLAGASGGCTGDLVKYLWRGLIKN